MVRTRKCLHQGSHILSSLVVLIFECDRFDSPIAIQLGFFSKETCRFETKSYNVGFVIPYEHRYRLGNIHFVA